MKYIYIIFKIDSIHVKNDFNNIFIKKKYICMDDYYSLHELITQIFYKNPDYYIKNTKNKTLKNIIYYLQKNEMYIEKINPKNSICNYIQTGKDIELYTIYVEDNINQNYYGIILKGGNIL